MYHETTMQELQQRTAAKGWRAIVTKGWRAIAPLAEAPVRPAEELLQGLRAHQAALELHIEELRQTQLALEKSRDSYAHLYEFAPAGYFTLTSDGMIVDMNHTGATLLAMAHKELSHHHFSFFIAAPLDRDRWNCIFMSVLQRGERQSCELELQRGDDSMFYAELDCWHEEVDGISSVRIALTDITAHKMVENELQVSKNKLEAMLDAIPDLLFEVGLDGRYLDYHSAHPELLLAPPKVFIGKTIYDILLPDAADVVMSALREAHEKGSSLGRQIEMPLPQGTMWFELSVSRKHNIAGQEPRFIVLSRDITGRKQAEEEREQYFRLFNTAADLMCIADMHGYFKMVNPALVKILGYGEPELLSRPFTDFIHPDDQQAARDEISSRFQSDGSTVNFENRYICKDGSVRHLSWRASYDQEKQLCYANATDITERRAAENALVKSEERFRLIMETIDEVFWIADVPIQKMLYISPGYERVWGRTPQSLYENPRSFIEAIHPEDRKGVLSDIQAEKIGLPFDHEYRIVRPDGEIRWVWARGYPVHDESGKVSRYAGVAQDITDRKLAEVAAIAFESQEGAIVTDANGVIVRVNKAFTRITGYSTAEVVGQTPALLKSGRQDREFYERMWATLMQKQFWHGEIWNKHKNGKIFAEWLTISAVTAPDGHVDHYVGIFSEITQNRQAEAEIHRLAYYDPLTKLPNRRLLYDRLGQALASSKRHRQYGAILFLDLDNFKTLNDTLGHDFGDLLLTEAAQRLLGAVREGDTIARLGGDEFVLLLEELSEDIQEAAIQVSLIGDKLLAAIASPYMLKGVEFACTTSIGVSLFYNHHESVDELLKHADLAMYHAKKGGRNSLRFFDPDMQAALVERSALESDLRYALERQEFRIYYQIQVNSARHVIGAEALIRWVHPERGLISPDQFIPLAEETGLILPIGLWVLQTACTQIKAWSGNPATRDLQLAVNVSPRQFRQMDFVGQVQQVLSDSGINPARLKIELTEGLALDNLSDTVTKMHALIEQGISIAMDDFGTGYSSLTHLKQLPLDQLKIDQAFVRDLATDPNDAAIVQAIITLGRTFGLNVIAEGVETEAQLEFLDKYGCRAFQGYLFGRPMLVAEFEQLLLQYA